MEKKSQNTFENHFGISEDRALEIMRDLTAYARTAGTPFTAALLHKDGSVFLREQNRVSQEKDASMHAELLLLQRGARKAGRADLSEFILITTCEPCPMCSGAIYWSGIRKVIYGLSVPEIGEAGLSQLKIRMQDIVNDRINDESPDMLIFGGICNDEIRGLFKK
ncbi:MAG: nucleoside deaminase [Balneolales bacterium]|nr:nucleoside deaminase [Balneolales bacterium]